MADRDQRSSSMESGLEDIPLDELLRMHRDDLKLDLLVAFPARVASYDAPTQTARVTPMMSRALPDGQGNYIERRLPALADVPVEWLRGGGFAASVPLAAGDEGLIVVCMRSLGAWRASSDSPDAPTPGDLGMHTLDGAVFRPGLSRDSRALKTASATNMVIGLDTPGSTGQIEITPGGEIHCGAGAAQGVAIGPTVDSNLAALATAIAACAPSPIEPLATAIKTAFGTWFASYTATGSPTTKTR